MAIWQNDDKSVPSFRCCYYCFIKASLKAFVDCFQHASMIDVIFMVSGGLG